MTLYPTTEPNISLHVLPKIPATLQGASGIAISKVNGVWTVTPQWETLPLIAPILFSIHEVSVRNTSTGAYARMLISDLLGGAGLGSAPVTKSGTSGAQGAAENSLIINASGAYTLTLLAPSAGRMLLIKSLAAFAISSASANVCPLGSATPGTAILTAGVGKWAILQGDGTNWIVMLSG